MRIEPNVPKQAVAAPESVTGILLSKKSTNPVPGIRLATGHSGKINEKDRLSLFFRYGCLALLLLVGITSLPAQELNATVKVHGSGVGGANQQLFRSLEEALRTFINGRKWTDTRHSTDERIDCSFTLVVAEALPADIFRGELYVQSHRPVENSSRSSPLLNLHDREMEFDYTGYQPLQFDPHAIRGTLEATIAYYVYLVLGLDLDSRSPLGGTSCFRKMEWIASAAQSSGWKGWDRRNHRNRPAIAAALNDGALEDYRQMWFDYHRQGLDVPAGHGGPGVSEIVPSLRLLSGLHAKRAAAILVRLFGDAKLEEMVTLLAGAGAPEKEQAYDALLKLYPVRRMELERLRLR